MFWCLSSEHLSKVSIDTLNDTLNDVERKIITQIINDNGIKAGNIAVNTGIAISTVKRYLSAMQKKGLIVRIGARKTGHWEVKPK